MKTINEVFQFNLRRLRGKRSQAEMAETAGIPVRSYQYMEDGNLPQRPNLVAIAEAHGIPETHLFIDPDYSPDPNHVRKITPKEAVEVFRELPDEVWEVIGDVIEGYREGQRDKAKDLKSASAKVSKKSG